MENSENNPEISKEREKNELDYHAWLKDIYNEIRNVHLKATCFHGNVLKLMDRFIDYFRIYLRKNPPDKSKTMHDFYLARATSRIILLFRDLITEENDHEYLLRICELLGGSTVLWIRYYSYMDQESGEAHIESILNSYAFYLQSTTDESFLLKIFAHVLFANKKLPEIFSTILEKFLIMRVQRQGRRDQETKEDQLYILYIIAFKQWEILRRQNVGITDIPKYANDFMKPMISILSNHRYAPYLPAITPNDIEEGKATRIILRKFQMRYLSRLAEATIKQDWLRGSDINTPITVDLSIEDDVNQSELVEVNQVDSVNREVENLSINETNVTVSKELWWVQILQKKAMKNLKNRTNNYKVVEVIEIDDKEDDEICEAVIDTTTLSTTVEDTQSKTELQKDTDNRMQSEIVNKEDRAKMLEEELQVSIPAETNIEIQNEPIEQEMNDGENVSSSEENINKTEEELIGNAGTCSNQPDKYEKMDTKQSKKKDENLIDTSTSTGSFNRSILKVYKGPTSSKSKTRNLIELPTNPITLENPDIDLEKGDADEIPKEIVNTNDNELIDPIEKNSEIPSVISEEIPSIISEQTLKDTHKKINVEEVTDTISNARNEVSINDEILDKLDEESVISKKGKEESRNAENKMEARMKNKNQTGKQEVLDKSKSIIEEKMDITIENRVTSKENSDENISTFVLTSEELHSPISSALAEDNEKCDNSILTTNEHNNELLEISSADIERHIQNRDNDEEEIGKTIEDFASDEDINLTASIPRNVSAPNSNTLTELEQNSSEDEEAISIICIEETKLRSPINFSERNVSKTQTEITADEINIEHNLIIDQLETSKSIKTKVYEKKHQNKNKEFSEHQVSNKNEYIPFKNADVTEKESEENHATIQRAEAETTIPPQSLEDDDRSSISSIVESETYEIIDPKTDDIHIEKIKPIKITETGNRKKPVQENSIFSIATDKKLSCTNFENKFPEESAQSNRVIFSTSTVHSRKKRSISPEYSFSPIRDSFESIHGEMDEIKSPSVESFSKSDTDEFKKLFNNTYKDSLQADDESCTEEEEDEYSMANSCFLNSPTISKRTNKVVPKPSILCKKESISTTVKRKAVSFAPIPQHKKSPLMANRSVNFDSTIIERKTYDSPLTIETEPQIWKSSINTTSISNQHEQSTNEHELDNILSTSDINCFGSPSPSLIKDSVSKISTSFPNRVVKRPAASNKLLEHGFWSGRKSPPPGGKNSSFNGQTKQQVHHNGSQQLNKNNNRNHQEDKKIMVLKNEKNTLHNSKPSFNKEIINKTPTKRNIDLEVLKKISSIQINRSESMSDFDRYLQERKRGSFNIAKRDWTFYYLNSSPYLITNKFNSNCESHSKASGNHGKDDKKLTEININVQKEKDKNDVKNSNENDLKLINSFNDPQLKKKAVVQLIMLKEKDFTTPPRTSNHNNNNINIEKTQDHCDKSTLPESLPSSVNNIELMKDIQSKSSTMMTMMTTTATTTTTKITTTEQQNTTTKLIEDNSTINNIITTDENKKFLSTQFRSPSKPKKDDYLTKAFEQNTILKTFLKDRCTDIVFGSKSSSSVVVRKRRSSVDSEIVVRVFTDKNKKHSNSDINGTSSPPNPLVLLKRMRDNDVYKNIKKKNREHSSHKRNIDELPDHIDIHNEKKKKRITLPNGKRNRRLKSKSTGTIYQENCTNSNIQSWTHRNKPNIQIIDKISSPLNDRLYSKLELKKKSETKSKLDEFPNAIEDKIYFKEIHHPRIVNSSSSENKQKILNIKEESENETSKQNITQNPSLEEETLGNVNNETENIHPVNDFSVPGSPANSSNLTETFGSPTSSTDGKTDDSKSLNDSSKSNYSCSRLEEVSEIESNSVTLENTSNEFSMTSQSCNNIFVPDKEFNSTQENVSENESPLLILSDPRDGLLISDQTNKIKSKQRKKMVKDTLDLAILPKRRKVLDSLDSNATSNGEENGNAIISITEASTIEGESIKKKQCTQESEEHDEQNSRIGLPVINENNSLNIAAIPGTESPEINVNIEIGKTYSKDNLVQNVFVPPELEMNFEDVSKAQKATTHFKRKGLSKSPVVV